MLIAILRDGYMKGLNLSLYTFIGQFIMAIYEDYYVISSNAHIKKSVPTNLDKDFKKELIDDNGDLKPHVKKIENVIYYGKPCIKATLPTLFIEIEYKTSDSHYLISHEVFLYEEDYPNFKKLEDYKNKFNFNFASQVEPEVYEIVDAFHNSQGCICLSSGEY